MGSYLGGGGSLASARSKAPEWKQIHIRDYDSMVEEIAKLRGENCRKDEEIRRWAALCKRRGRDLDEMEEWITRFKPVMDENERKLKEQEHTIVELSRTVKRLKDIATTLLLVVLTQINSYWLNSHWLNTFSYHVKLA